MLALVSPLPIDALYRSPGADDWTVTQVLAHTAEYLRYWAAQAVEVAAHGEADRPFGRTHVDPDRIAAVTRHASDSRDVAVSRVRAALVEATAALRAIPAERWTRTGRHERRGVMTVEQLVDQFLLAHADEHLAQAEILAA